MPQAGQPCKDELGAEGATRVRRRFSGILSTGRGDR